VTDSADELLTIDEVAGLLKLNRQTLYNYVDRGELPALRVGKRRVRIRRSALEDFIAAGESDAVKEPAHAEGLERFQQAPVDLPSDGRERLATSLADAMAALDGDDREQAGASAKRTRGRRSRPRRSA